MAIDEKLILKWILLTIVVILGILLLRFFITPLALAVVVAALLYKVHKKLSAKIGQNFSAGLLTFLVLFLIFSLVAFGANTLLNELGKVYQIIQKAKLSTIKTDFGFSLEDIVKYLTQQGILFVSEFVLSLPKILLLTLVFAIALFYFLRDGERLYAFFKKFVPLSEQQKAHLFEGLERYFNAFVKIWLAVGVLQFIIATVGFLIFDLPAPLLAGLIAAILSILPILGPYALYLPVGAIMILQGNVNPAIGFLAYSLTASAFLDYVVRPYFAGKWATIHPLIIMIGMLGGILLIGPAGILVGPACMVLILSILHSYGYVNKCGK